MYRQEVNLFKLGRMPLNCVIDAKGYVRFAHYGSSMKDIPFNDELFQVIDELNKTSA
jgi:peroxiredoxin Q/BCP